MADNQATKNLVEPLYRVRGWIKLCAVLAIVQGIFSIFSVVGILFCWIPIWMGVLLYKAAKQLEVAHQTLQENELHGALQKIATYFKIFGILLAVVLVVSVVGVIAAILIPAFVGYQQGTLGG